MYLKEEKCFTILYRYDIGNLKHFQQVTDLSTQLYYQEDVCVLRCVLFCNHLGDYLHTL